MTERSSWREVGIIDAPEARHAYDEARLRRELGRSVRECRVAPGPRHEQLRLEPPQGGGPDGLGEGGASGAA